MSFVKNLAKHIVWGTLWARHWKSPMPLRVLGGPAKGTILRLDVRSHGQYWLGNYDRYAFDRVPWGRYLKAGDTAWDCGAYVGYYTAVFRRHVGAAGRVVAFEASSLNHSRLALLPADNRWDNVAIHRLAVGEARTEIAFAAHLGGASGPFGLSKKYENESSLKLERVRCAGVDELVFAESVPAPRFIKFDLESAEVFALHNGARVYEEMRPVILLELHGPEAGDAAGRFLEIHRYAATPVERLASLAGADERAWLDSLRASAVRTASELHALPYLPHMMLVLPREHPDWTAGAAR